MFKTDIEEVWKILLTDEAVALLQNGHFDGSEDDKRDGFIHLSTHAQLAGTIAKHFSGQGNLLALACPTGRLGDALRWEESRNGALFPHLYRQLRLTDVKVIIPTTPDWIAQLADA